MCEPPAEWSVVCWENIQSIFLSSGAEEGFCDKGHPKWGYFTYKENKVSNNWKCFEVGQKLGHEGAWGGREEAGISSICNQASASHQVWQKFLSVHTGMNKEQFVWIVSLLIQSLSEKQYVDKLCLYFFHFLSNQAICNNKTVYEVQQTVFEKPADSFKRAWFTLPDSFKILRTPCQTVLNCFGFFSRLDPTQKND